MSLCPFLHDGNSGEVPFRLLPPRQLASETALSDGLETDGNVLAIVEVAGIVLDEQRVGEHFLASAST